MSTTPQAAPLPSRPAAGKRSALVTGGASGIGKAIVERLAREGLRVFMADLDEARGASAAAAWKQDGLDVTFHAVDLRSEEAMRALAAALPPLQALVNNAGVFDERDFFEVTPADFHRAFDVNMLAPAILTQACAQTMGRDGRIINIASRAYLGARNHPHYVASKAALVGYTRASAIELASRGIMVNAIAPGLIDTPLLRELPPERYRALLDAQPMGAAGRPEDVAHAAAFLASPHTCFITGQVLFVDGGKSLGGASS